MRKIKLKKIDTDHYTNKDFTLTKENTHWVLVDINNDRRYIENTFVAAYKTMVSIGVSRDKV